MTSDGKFDFNVYNHLNSSQFKVSSTSTMIYARTTNMNDSSKSFTITLHGAGCGLSGISKTYQCRDFYNSNTFTGLTVGSTYYFELFPVHGTGTVIGDGYITNFGGLV
jgi:hypothetical protein